VHELVVLGFEVIHSTLESVLVFMFQGLFEGALLVDGIGKRIGNGRRAGRRTRVGELEEHSGLWMDNRPCWVF
jgi:hypothetical protein